MTDRGLELHATEELIEELLRRTAFHGVIIHSRDAVGNRAEPDERTFSVRFNAANFQTEEVGRLLDVVSRRLADAV